MKLFMPIQSSILDYIDNITVGFKNTSVAQKTQNKLDNNSDWLCTEGIYDNEVITCKIPNIPHFDHENPFYMLDVSINGQDFTELPHTFRYYFITDVKITPNESQDEAEPEITIQANGLFDTPHKQLRITLSFDYQEKKILSERNVELKWNKVDKLLTFKLPKLAWIIGDHAITPDLLEAARKYPCVLHLYFAKNECI